MKVIFVNRNNDVIDTEELFNLSVVTDAKFGRHIQITDEDNERIVIQLTKEELNSILEIKVQAFSEELQGKCMLLWKLSDKETEEWNGDSCNCETTDECELTRKISE
jgi:hypothetical protein